MNKKFAVAIILVTAVCGLLFSASRLQSAVKKTALPENAGIPEIRVVMDDNYPPFSFRGNDGQLQGILVDQWQLWSEKTGIDVRLTGMSWDQAVHSMAQGQFDVIDTIFADPEREKIFDFTAPYRKIDVSIFFHKNLSGINTVQTLQGLPVAVKRSDSSVSYLIRNGVNNFQLYDSYEEIIQAAKGNKTLIFVMDQPPAAYFLYKYGVSHLFRQTQPMYSGELHRAVKKGNQVLLHLVDQGFQRISSEESAAIDVKWYGQNSPAFDSRNLYYLAYLLAAAMFSAGILLIWNWTLKRKVNAKTAQLTETMEQLKASQVKSEAIIKAIPDLVFLLDGQGRFLDYFSEAEHSQLYVPRDKFIDRTLAEVFPPELTAKISQSIQTLLSSGKMQHLEYALPYPGSERYFEARLVSCGADRILCLVRDITERQEYQQKIFRMSVLDDLTGCYNRNYFDNQVKLYQEQGTLNLGLLVCDIDGLKLVNDTLGHAVGDSYIRMVADILTSCAGEGDLLARVGGDEFVMVVQDTSEENLESYKKKIQAMVNQRNQEVYLIPVSISIGYAALRDPAMPVAGIYKAADDCMYREKLHHLQSIKSKNIELLIKMLAERDFLTSGHGERLQGLACRLAMSSGMTVNAVNDMALLAQFHDIGKIAVPDRILFKPGKLTAEERLIMQRHPETGYRIAQTSPDLCYIAEWILKHHESWDGGGYPIGLRGENIPLQCRILAIADAYDAMTNDRPYRQAMSREAACRELKRCAGSQFDPRLVELFIGMVWDLTWRAEVETEKAG